MNFEILKSQIGIGNLMAVGAREFQRDESHTIMFKVGNKPYTKLIIKLEADDTYSVRYYRMSPKTYKALVDEKVEGVYAENIGAVVRKMGDR